jgi:hypothetical protein
MLEQYKIHNTSFLNPSVEYSDSSMNKSFQQDLENFKDSIMSNIHDEESLTYYHDQSQKVCYRIKKK